MEKLVAIQHLRAVAVLGVVFYHALQWEWIPFEPGGAGVELFFIISGFVMWLTTSGRDIRPRDFIARRIARVVPLYWLASLTVLSIVLIWPGSIPNIIPDLRHVLLSLFFIPHLDPAGAPFPLLNPGWTLNYEAIFYLVFSVCLLVEERWRAQTLTGLMAAIYVFGGFIVTEAYYFGFNAEMLVFVSGVWLARAWQADLLPERNTGLALIALGLIILAILTALRYEPAIWRPLLFGAPAMLIMVGWLALAADKRGVPPLPWLARLGDASYSIYLVHTLVAPPIAKAFLGQPWIFIPLNVAVGVGTGLVCHSLVEKPLVQWARRWLERRREAAAPAQTA